MTVFLISTFLLKRSPELLPGVELLDLCAQTDFSLSTTKIWATSLCVKAVTLSQLPFQCTYLCIIFSHFQHMYVCKGILGQVMR